MPSQLTIGIILALLLSVVGLGWYAKHQAERAAVAQAAIADAQAAGDAWRLALDQQTIHAKQQADKLAESAQGYELLRRSTDRRLREYETAIKSDPGAHDWNLAFVPAYVARRMCEYVADESAGESGMPADPKAVHRSNPCAIDE